MNHPFRRRSAIMLTTALAAIASSSLAQAEDNFEADEKGLTARTGDLEVNLGGRLQLDASVFDHGIDNGTAADVRRARVEFSARLGDVVRVRAEREFAQADGWRGLWIGITPVKNLEFRGGNQVVPFSMEDMQNSNTMPFVERSLTNAFAPGFGLGGSARFAHDNFTLSAGYFTDAIADEVGQSRVRGDGFAARATFAPIQRRGSFLHFGAAYENRSFDAANPPRFTVVSASALAPRLLRTGALDRATDLDAYNAEFAYGRGSFQVQAQYIAAQVERLDRPTLSYDGWYGQASWMVTGERYRYSRGNGTPSGPQIGRNGGAIELATRYSQIDLDDVTLDRGRASALSVAASWYVDRNVRLMANYARTETSDSLITPDASGNVGVVRFQLAF